MVVADSANFAKACSRGVIDQPIKSHPLAHTVSHWLVLAPALSGWLIVSLVDRLNGSDWLTGGR